MGQMEIVESLKDRGWVSIKALQVELNISRTNINKSVNQLEKYGLVVIITDGKRNLVRLK